MVRNNHRLVEPSLSASMVRADVIGLLSFNVGLLSVKVSQSTRILSMVVGQKRGCYRAGAQMLSVHYQLGAINERHSDTTLAGSER